MDCMGFAPIEVGKILPSTTYRFLVPQTRKSRDTTLWTSLDPILSVACMWAEVTMIWLGMKRRFFSTDSALFEVGEDHGTHAIAQDIFGRRKEYLLCTGEEHDPDCFGHAAAEANFVRFR